MNNSSAAVGWWNPQPVMDFILRYSDYTEKVDTDPSKRSTHQNELQQRPEIRWSEVSP